MKLKVIACKVLQRELCSLAARSENFIDLTFLRQGFHETPDILRQKLQAEIDRIDAGKDDHTSDTYTEDFDAILIGYGLCSNGLVGVHSNRYPLVVPRAHDCITLLLGSKERYASLFSDSPGSYWYTPGWIENARMPSATLHNDLVQQYLDEGYDEDTAEYLAEELSGWVRDYKTAIFISSDESIAIPSTEERAKSYARAAADALGWSFREEPGDISLLKRMIAGEWDPADFLVIPPRTAIAPSHDAGVLCGTDLPDPAAT